MIFEHPEYDAHERILHVADADTGLRAVIAIHRGRGRTAAGGVRFRPYASEHEALTDVLRLSRAMTYKNVLAELPLGGGKSVILGDPAKDKSPALLRAFGRVVESLGGRYMCGPDIGTTADDMDVIAELPLGGGKSVILGDPAKDKSPALLRAFGRVVESLGGRYMCGPDIGTTADDMDVIAEETDHVGATNRQMGSSGPPTALGVFHGVRALAEHLGHGSDLRGLRVAIQGAGAVGSDLAVHLVQAGASVTIADVDSGAIAAVRARAYVDVVPPGEILEVEADILSPCALGGILDEDTIPRLRVRGVCGGANNQLAADADAERLRARGIPVVPDFVASAGGVIAGTAAAGLYPREEMQEKLEGIQQRALEILRRADQQRSTPHRVAYRMAEEMLADELRRPHVP